MLKTLIGLSAFLTLALSGCGNSDTSDLHPGAYVKRVSDNQAQLIIVDKDRQRTTIDGYFKGPARYEMIMGRWSPSSVSGEYDVSIKQCGVLHFIDTKAGALCTTCQAVSFPNCPATISRSLIWSPLGI